MMGAQQSDEYLQDSLKVCRWQWYSPRMDVRRWHVKAADDHLHQGPHVALVGNLLHHTGASVNGLP